MNFSTMDFQLKNMNAHTLILLFLLTTRLLTAQDLHLSNYQPAGMLTNAALTGNMGADYQISFQYRNQWMAIPEHAYTTFGLGAEMKWRQLGLGVLVNKNDAGPASLSATQVLLSAAYHRPLGQHSTLSLGASGGMLQKRILPEVFSWDSQYVDGEGFDSSLPSGEPFLQTSRTLADFSIGIGLNTAMGASGKTKLRLGANLAHVNVPNESFYGEAANLPMRTTLHGSLQVQADEHFFIEPHFLYLHQGQHAEQLLGANFLMVIEEDFSVRLGLASRMGDALVGQAELQMADKSFWFSYDATVSGLRSANANKGAWEAGIYLRFNKRKKEMEELPTAQLKSCTTCPSSSPLQDTDGDTVPDSLDQCPLEPGLPCFYGCNDRDHDGVWDHLDACPNLFGPPENNGCPVQGRDSDRDGIPDNEDYCPFLKGIAAFHGCPDSDGDGVSDIDDECPYVKGNPRSKGCPKNAKENSDPLLPGETVYFEFDKTNLLPQYRILLEQLARRLANSNGYRLLVAGHTDEEGTNEYNYQLGLQRAQVVRDFLILKGVPASAIEIISYGELIPAAPNDTESGRARNRRVEVVVLKGAEPTDR